MTVKHELWVDEQFRDMEGGDLVCHYLKRLGVGFVFGIPGGAIEPFFNALARAEGKGGPRFTLACHEGGAAFMADGYTRQTGKLGVCCATTGPGATNLLTGVASAYENNTPMLVITAQTPLPTFGRGAFQDSSCTGINTVDMFGHCTRYSTFVSHIQQLPRKLARAIARAHGPVPGPVHVSVPLDVMREKLDRVWTTLSLDEAAKPAETIDAVAAEKLYENIVNAKNTTLVLGPHCSHAIGEIFRFAEIFDAKIVTTPDAKGLVNSDYYRYYGVIGFAGHASAWRLLSEGSDCIIAVDTDLSEWATGGWDSCLLGERFIHVDACAEHFTRSPNARLHVLGNVETLFRELNSRHEKGQGKHIERDNVILLPNSHRVTLDEPKKYLSDDAPVKPQRLMKELGQKFPGNTRYYADVGNSMAWAIHYLPIRERRCRGRRKSPGRLLNTVVAFGSMGWAIGASIGAALGYREGPVVCITGDGSLLMNGQELSVAVREKLPLILVVLNDGSLGMVKHGQRLNHAEAIGYELPNVDISMWARSMGADAYDIRSPLDMDELDIEALCTRRAPSVLNVFIDANEVPPMNSRTKVV